MESPMDLNIDLGIETVSLTARRAACRKRILSAIAFAAAREIRAGESRDVAIPAAQAFIATQVPAGRGQAAKAKAVTESAVDQALEHIAAQGDDSDA